MGSSIATRISQGKSARKPTGVIKLQTRSPIKPKFNTRSLDKYFWYTAPDGITRLAIGSGSAFVPEQVNDYEVNPAHFQTEPYPSTFPAGGIWPPRHIEDIVPSIGSEYSDCVGDTCYTNKHCDDPSCGHTFENWKKATQDWEDHFELRMTEGRGIGVYTKRRFKKCDILGWYAGELKPLDELEDGDYFMEMEIGEIPDDWYVGGSDATVFIDGARKGNWTRFINHSCDSHTVFTIMRVGNVRIMAIEAIRDVPKGVELTVSYGDEYYGLTTYKICACGTRNCVGKLRRPSFDGEFGKKAKVKKCKRLSPPLE